MAEDSKIEWTAKLAGHNTEFPARAYTRPDGTTATYFGSSKALLLVEGNHSGRDPVGYEDRDPASAAFRGSVCDRVFRDARTAPEFVSPAAAWRAACGLPEDAVPAEVECDNCDGTGRDECPACDNDRDCPECGGTGKVEEWPEPAAPPKWVRAGGLWFQGSALARVVSVLPDGDLAWAVLKPKSMLVMAGDGWKAVAMAVHGDPPGGSPWTELPEPTHAPG